MNLVGQLSETASENRPEPLSVLVARELVREVGERNYPPGHALPTEVELSRRFGVSRVIVREALARLKADGIVSSQRGRGLFVASLPPATLSLGSMEMLSSSDLLQILELRGAVETQATSLAARRRSAQDLDAMSATLVAMESALETGDVEAGIAADLAFHRSIFVAAGNDYFLKLLDFLMVPLMAAIAAARRQSAQNSGRGAQAQREHAAIFEAIRQGNARTAKAAAQRHIDGTATRLSAAQEAQNRVSPLVGPINHKQATPHD